MFDQSLYLFAIASLLLNLTPGNDMILVASRAASQGIRAGIFSAFGIFIGCLVHVFAAIFGLSFIIAQSAFLFNLIKFLGAGYLIYLGCKSIFAKSTLDGNLSAFPNVDQWQLLKQGIITNALNPKVAIFFLSFLPQFIAPNSSLFKLQLFVLGMWFDVQGTIILIVMAFLMAKTTNFIKQNPRFWIVQEKLTGLIFIGLAVKLALSRR